MDFPFPFLGKKQTMDTTLKEAIASQTSFSLRLATHLLSLPEFRNSNYAFSPLSIHSVLSLLTAGTTGPTLKQLLSFLGCNAAEELSALHSHVSNFLLADGSAAGGPCLRIAFGVWLDDHHDTNLTNSFREIAGSVYKAVVNPVPFRTKPRDCAVQINHWYSLLHAALWSIWKECNRRIFNTKRLPPEMLAIYIEEEARQWRLHC